jgi:hypothetical protein
MENTAYVRSKLEYEFLFQTISNCFSVNAAWNFQSSNSIPEYSALKTREKKLIICLQ